MGGGGGVNPDNHEKNGNSWMKKLQRLFSGSNLSTHGLNKKNELIHKNYLIVNVIFINLLLIYCL